MCEMLVPNAGEDEARHRSLPVLEIEYLYRIGVVTEASVERARIINDYIVMSKKIKRRETIYFKLSERHYKSFYTIRNIVLTFLRNCD